MNWLHIAAWSFAAKIVLIVAIALCSVLTYAYFATHPKCRLCDKRYFYNFFLGTAQRRQQWRNAQRKPTGTRGSLGHLKWLSGGACSACYDAGKKSE
jgi:hypothetical protein